MGCIRSTTSTTDDAEEGVSQLHPKSSISRDAVKLHSHSFNSFPATISAKHHSLSSHSLPATTSAKHHSFSSNSFPAAAYAKRHSLSSASASAAASAFASASAFIAAVSPFVDVNSDVMYTINKIKDEILTNPDLVHVIIDHLNSINDTILLSTAIKHSLEKARGAGLLVRQAIVHLEDYHDPKAALDKLWQFKKAPNPFTENIEEFKLMIKRKKSILQDLCHRKEELDGKQDNAKAWGQVCQMVYWVALAGISIGAVVLAALGVAPAVIIPITVVFSAMPQLRKFVKKGWDKFQRPREGERVVIDSLGKGTEFAIEELNSMKALVEELDIMKIKSVHLAEFAIKEREIAALKMGMVAIQLMSEKFSKRVDDLEKEVDRHVTELKKTTITILETFLDSLKSKKGFKSRLCTKSTMKKKVISLAKLARKSARALIGRK